MENALQSAYHSNDLIAKQSHFHDCHQIILVVNGSVEFNVNGKFFSAPAGSVAIFSRYENHSVRVCSPRYERYVLQLNSDMMNKQSPIYSLLTDRPVGFSNIVDVKPCLNEITDIFKRILKERSVCAKFAKEMEQLLINQLLIIINRCMSIEFGVHLDEVVTSVKRAFENDYGKHYTLSEIARQYNISVSSLSHRFVSVTGVSVMEYLLLCRIAQAKVLLVNTDLSIGEIVEKCGFSDNSNFSRTFKQNVGIAPSKFRRNYIQ